MKKNPDGSENPYELNCTYLDALADPETDLSQKSISRFLSSQAIMLAMNGIPAVYFHSLVGTRNYHEGVRRYGFSRAINRRKWEADALEKRLADESSHNNRIFSAYRQMLRLRSRHPSFHPDGPVKVLDLDKSIFAMQRTAPDGSESVLSLTNLSDKSTKVDLKATGFAEGTCRDIISGSDGMKGKITIPPCETLWLKE